MKSYDETAYSVLEKARKRIKKRKTVLAAGSLSAVGCLAALTICALFGELNGQCSPTGDGNRHVSSSVDKQPTMAQTRFLRPVCYSNGEISLSSLEESIPMQFVLDAIDVKGLTEEEIKQVRLEKTKDLAEMEQTWAEEGYAYRISATVYNEDTLVIYASSGGFCLDVEDWTKVKEIRGQCHSEYGKIQCAVYANARSKKSIIYSTIDKNGEEHVFDKPIYRHGNCWIYGQNIVIPGDSLRSVYNDIENGKGSLLFSWEPNQALFDALASDANFDLPRITFSFTLCYEDGTEVEHTFTAESHDGVGYITYAAPSQ